MGRYWNGLEMFDDINLLLKFLYLDESHYIDFKTPMGITFRMRMDDEGNLYRYLLSLGEDAPRLHCYDITHLELNGFVKQLKEQPAVDFPETFKNRWEEIKEITKTNLGLNYMNQRGR